MWDGYGPMMGWGWMWIFWVLIVIGVVLLAIVVIHLLRGRGTRAGEEHDRPERATGALSARQILEQRYARGEIDTEEYRERLKDRKSVV